MPDEPIPTPFPTPAAPFAETSPQAQASPFRQAQPIAPQALKTSPAKSPLVLGLIATILVLIVLIIIPKLPKREASNNSPAIEKLQLESKLAMETNRRLRLERGLPAAEFTAPSTTANADSSRLDHLQRQLDTALEEISVLKLRVRELESKR